jgi:CheY-like chemotaxis protein
MSQNRKKILVIDDNELHLYTTKALLQDERYEVITHQNGFGVTDLVTTLQPDLILLDMNMPVLSGEQVAFLLRLNSGISRVPILFFSSYDDDTMRENASLCGVTGYIYKGDIAELRQKVLHYLGISTADHAARTTQHSVIVNSR